MAALSLLLHPRFVSNLSLGCFQIPRYNLIEQKLVSNCARAQLHYYPPPPAPAPRLEYEVWLLSFIYLQFAVITQSRYLV